MPNRPDPSNLDDVFRDFRDEVSRQSAVDQAEQHYKVALTYRDMGMVDDAVRELEQAAKSPRLRFDASALLARLLRDRGDVASAVEWFERAAEAPAPTKDGRQLYKLGQALEDSSETSRALAVYLELQADARDYRDVTARVGIGSRACRRKADAAPVLRGLLLRSWPPAEIILPWTMLWDRNYLLAALPWVHELAQSPYVRGPSAVLAS